MKPFVSIIYLTKNGGTLLEKSLQAVIAQVVDFAFEVIAIDSGSTDGTLALFEKYPVKVYRIPTSEFNFGLTRDYGFSLAQGDIVIAISQDVVPVGTDWLQNLVSPFSDNSIAVVQGCNVLLDDAEAFYWHKMGLFYYTRESKRWLEQYGNISLSFTNCALRRDVWKENKLGRVAMSEDKLFQKMVTEKGLRIFRQMCAKAYHSHVYNVASLAKRSENEGLGWRYVAQRYSFRDMLGDICKPEIYNFLWRGLKSGEIKRLAEALFPLIRPIYLYKGNNFTKHYV